VDGESHRAAGGGFMQIIDSYIIRDWLFYLAILLAAFAGVYVIFDFFQLLSDIMRNQVRVGVVLDYCRFLVPEAIYLMLPLSILVATLVRLACWRRPTRLRPSSRPASACTGFLPPFFWRQPR
jgi:hypothetical protein